ncbi:MAG: lipoyl(octanoyl) transferase LipB [Candidatus Dormibacteraceae bacterium]
MGSLLRTYWLGRIDYRKCWDLQRAMVQAIMAEQLPDSLLLLEHPPVFTMGRRGGTENLRWSVEECAERGIEVVWSDRGGDITYHGPGQLVGYGLLNLRQRGIDILTYIRQLETSLIEYLAQLGITAWPGGHGLTGVWSQGEAAQAEKVAAIGVRFNRRRITSHGFALNLTTDLNTFNNGMVPCGLEGRQATSVAALGGPRIIVQKAALEYAPHFARIFNLHLEWSDSAELEILPSAPEAPAMPAPLPML